MAFSFNQSLLSQAVVFVVSLWVGFNNLGVLEVICLASRAVAGRLL